LDILILPDRGFDRVVVVAAALRPYIQLFKNDSWLPAVVNLQRGALSSRFGKHPAQRLCCNEPKPPTLR
jgi:hypothetical protein